MAELDDDSLAADEQAYFDSKGESSVEIKDDLPAGDTAAEGDDGSASDGDGSAEGQQERKRVQMVPHQALHEAREETKREREERRRFEETVNQRLALLTQERTAPKPEPAPEPPDAANDPLGRIAYLESLIQKQGQTQEQAQRQFQETQARTQVAQFAQVDEQNARKQAPDFDEAKHHLMMSRGRELFVASGGTATDAQIRQQLAIEEEQLRITAIQQGTRPSIALYQMAVARGYTPKQAAQAAAAGNDKIAALADAQRDNKTLSSAGGGAADGPMTAQRLANMSAEDFAAYSEKNGKTVRKLMGG